MDNEENQTADEALEESRDDQANNTLDQEKLAEDNDSPAQPSENAFSGEIPEDHPSTDTGQDASEVYEEGRSEAGSTPASQDVGDQSDEEKDII